MFSKQTEHIYFYVLNSTNNAYYCPMFYSFVIPVYNRPDHMEDLLDCLANQSIKSFEVIVVESGSSIKSDKVVESYKEKLDIQYFYKANEGQGISRNYGMERCKGEYIIIIDSDVVLDNDYVEQVDTALNDKWLDAYGGPDRLHPSSTTIQRTVNFLMTSFFTTGGTRGGNKQVGKYYPRSFNMGVSREVYEKTKGYKIPFLGEDLEWSTRIMENGFSTGMIEKAHVYHERKKNFKGFYKQLHWFGRSRINFTSFYPKTLKIVHLIPLIFTLYFFSLFLVPFLPIPELVKIFYTLPLLGYLQAVFLNAIFLTNSFSVALRALPGVFILMFAYAFGLLQEFTTQYILNKKPDYKPR